MHVDQESVSSSNLSKSALFSVGVSRHFVSD